MKRLFALVALVWFPVFCEAGTPTTPISWISMGAGNWHGAGNWSLARIPTNMDSVFLTNALTKAAFITSATTGTTAMTIFNLTVRAPGAATNTVQLSNPGTIVPLRILNSCTLLTSGAWLEISNGVVQVDGSSAFAFSNDGRIILEDPTAKLIVTNGSFRFGIDGGGVLTVSNGSVLAKDMSLGYGPASLGALYVAGGVVTVLTDLTLANPPAFEGRVWLTGGQLTVTNGLTTIDRGHITISNGTFLARTLIITADTNTASQGTLTVAGGTFIADRLVATNSGATIRLAGGVTTLRGADVAIAQLVPVGTDGRTAVLNLPDGTNRFVNVLLAIGYQSNATGTVWKTGGDLISTNALISVGYTGVGSMTVSNGTWRARGVEVGVFSGLGTLTLAGGTNSVVYIEIAGESLYSTGQVWMTGGRLLMTNGDAFVGLEGLGRLAVSNGIFGARGMVVGYLAKSRGTFTVVGGVSSIYSNLTVGLTACTSTGIVTVTGGQLRVTNNVANAVLEVRSGTLTQSGGTLDIDRLVITNFCARFVHTGGTLIIGLPTLSTFGDADGDGIHNQYELDNGLDPLSPADAAFDNDGDGKNNLEEYIAGTNPNDATSYLRFTSLVISSNNIILTWPVENYGVYYVQWGSNLLTGVTNDLSPAILVGTVAPLQTNYLDVGGATNRPARFYRVRGFID